MNAVKSRSVALAKFKTTAFEGMEFTHEITMGLPVLARPDLPRLRFKDDADNESVAQAVDQWNAMLAEEFEGAGYYAASQEDEDLCNNHVYVLFADDKFYADYKRMTAVEEVVINTPSF